MQQEPQAITLLYRGKNYQLWAFRQLQICLVEFMLEIQKKKKYEDLKDIYNLNISYNM